MSEIQNIMHNFAQLFMDFTQLLYQSELGKIILVSGICGVAIVIAFKIINIRGGKL